MYGDWSFPEASERIGQRRMGGGVTCGKSLSWGGGGKDIFLTKLGA